MWAWYMWSGGFFSTWYWWNISDSFSWDFWKFTNEYNWLFFDINSKTKNIKWQIKYDTMTTIILTLSTWSDYYSGIYTIENFFNNSNYISWYIKNNFDIIESTDDIQLKRIMSLTDWYWYIIAQNTGNEILNNKINNWISIYFASWTYDIFNSWTTIGSWFTNSWINYDSISQALTWWKAILLQFYITWWYLKTSNWIIPHLDLNIESNIDFSDIYYYITGTAIIGKYKTHKNIKKSTSNYKNPNYQNFIFPYYN
jgi:hypothetical protein